MNVLRVAALVVALGTVAFSSGVVAQELPIDCDDFFIPQMAQTELDKTQSDPHGLDPDRNGIACDDPQANTSGGSPLRSIRQRRHSRHVR